MIRKLMNWLHRGKLEAALDRELQYHLVIAGSAISRHPACLQLKRADKLYWS